MAEGKDPASAVVADRAQTNFTDPESRIIHTPDVSPPFDPELVEVWTALPFAQPFAQPQEQRLAPGSGRCVNAIGQRPTANGYDAVMPPSMRNSAPEL